MTEIIKNLKNLPFGGAFPVFDPDLMSKVNNLMHEQSLSDWLNDQTIHSRFLHRYYSWIKSSSLNNLTGLDGFPILAFSNGTSESFDKFYLKNHSRRFRCFRGEYMYHAASWRNYFPGWSWLDDGPIEANDAVVISLPFSDTGNQHPETVNIVEQCNRLGVPVLIDCAYYLLLLTGKSTVISVKWTPLTGKRNEEELGLHITGGLDQTLQVVGLLKETKAEFAEKRANLGVMAG